MTDIRKSDAQLDAEASALEDRDLDAAIAHHVPSSSDPSSAPRDESPSKTSSAASCSA